jgi:hypothetical protein
MLTQLSGTGQNPACLPMMTIPRVRFSYGISVRRRSGPSREQGDSNDYVTISPKHWRLVARVMVSVLRLVETGVDGQSRSLRRL